MNASSFFRTPRPPALLAVFTATVFATACSDITEPRGARELAFSVQPLSLSDGGRVTPPIAIAVRNEDGVTVPGWTGEVSLTLEGGPGVTLGGTLTQSVLAGYAIFDDLEVSGTGSGLRLTAHSGSLEEATSDPFDVHGVFQAASVTAGRSHSCALTAQGEAYCWGYNSSGQLGDGTTVDRWVTTRVVTSERFTSLSANRNHTCGLSTGGSVFCWGDNSAGQVGDGTFDDRSLPVAVAVPGSPVRVEAGGWHSCALNDVGEGYCWGDGGTLGVGNLEGSQNTPTLVVGGHRWVQLDAGYGGGCGLTDQGEAYCWGWNVYGEVGDGTRGEARAEPTLVTGGHTFQELMAGGGTCHGQTCGFTSEGTLLCWGKNYQRGIGPVLDRYWLSPTLLVNNPGFESFEPGPQMVCGITGDHSLYCLGDPSMGMMGPLVGRGVQEPTPVAQELSVTEVAIGISHLCAVTTGGQVYCWGYNSVGQLGGWENPMGVTYPVPVWEPPGN